MVVVKKKNITTRKGGKAERNNKCSETGFVTFKCALKRFFTHYFDFFTTAKRSEYWWMMLFVWGVSFIVLMLLFLLYRAVLMGQINLNFGGTCVSVLTIFILLFTVGTLIPMWSVRARRLHDAGFSAHLLWISLAFFVYNIVSTISQSVFAFFSRYPLIEGILVWLSIVWGVFLLVLTLLPSKLKGNKYRE